MQYTTMFSHMSTNKCSNDEYWKWKPVGDKPLDSVLTIRLTKEQKDKIKALPDWQERIRRFIDEIE